MVYPSIIILMSWHQHFWGPPKIQICFFLLPASTLAKFHFYGFQSVSEDCLHVTMCTNSIMYRLRSDIYILIQFAQNAQEGPVLDPGLENFPALYTRLSPGTLAPPKTRTTVFASGLHSIDITSVILSPVHVHGKTIITDGVSPKMRLAKLPNSA